jgi:hypothetical protein
MKLKFTKSLPDKEGYYWWTNFGEHTPCILRVTKKYNQRGFDAYNEEYSFSIEPPPEQLELGINESIDEDSIVEKDGEDTYKHGDELWCYIPPPFLPNNTKQVTPDCY